MTEKKEIFGTGVALVTPFTNSDNIDFNALENLVNHIIEGGVDFLVPLGTTGETPTLSKEEKLEVLNCVTETTADRVPIVVGVGGNHTKEVVENIQKMDMLKIDAILSVNPYYNKPNQRGLYEHFSEVAIASDVPIILYNIQGRTGVNLSTDTLLQLATDFPHIIGVKEASGNMMQIMEVINKRPKGFKVISGDDNLTLPILAAGGDGVISVVGNAFPKTLSDMVRLMLNEKDFVKAQKLHYELFDIVNMLFADGSPGGIKALMEHMGMMKNNLRLPLVKVNKTLNADLKNFVSSTKLK